MASCRVNRAALVEGAAIFRFPVRRQDGGSPYGGTPCGAGRVALLRDRQRERHLVAVRCGPAPQRRLLLRLNLW